MRIFRCILIALGFTVAAIAGNVPRAAPSLELKTTQGKTVSLQGLKGKVVAVLWLSTDCPHCQETCEELGPVYQELSEQGLEIMGMAVNPNAPGNIAAFKTKHKVEFPIGVATRSDWMRFADLSVMARAYVPYMMLVDRNGVIRYEHRGRDHEFWHDQLNNLRKEFDELLAESTGASR
jgi:peroxiredoxin